MSTKPTKPVDARKAARASLIDAAVELRRARLTLAAFGSSTKSFEEQIARIEEQIEGVIRG